MKDLLKKVFIKFLVKISYKKANLIISNSDESAHDLEKFINTKVVSLYNPCFYGFKKEKKKNYDKVRLINVGRFTDQKNQITIIKAIQKSNFREKFEAIFLVMAKTIFILKII